MTLFEYLSIATSLLLSFSLARALSNVAPIFQSQNRYWVHSLWVVVHLMAHLTLFWMIWINHIVVEWTLVHFVLVLIPPTCLLIGASLLVPSGPVSSYQAHFDAIKVPFYVLTLIMLVVTNANAAFLWQTPMMTVERFVPFTFALVIVVAILVRHTSVDKVLVVVAAIFMGFNVVAVHDHRAILAVIQGTG